jgi:LysR family hca operon transcriptional activator
VGETYVGVSNTPRGLRAIIGDYFKRRGIEIVPTLEIDNYAMAISLVASRRGVALLPISAENFLPWSVVSRPLKGEVPTIDPGDRISQGERVTDLEDLPLED